MRLLHTSDWHLGHTLHDVPRDREHERFLAWLLDRIGEHEVDALLVAGDVFDTANPSAAAQAALYRFVAAARRRFDRLEIVIIGGNHDSADRLDAPSPLLDGLDVRVVGGLPRRADRSLDLDRLLVPLRDRDGEVRAWVAAVPYLRQADLPSVDADDPLIEGVRAIYRDVLGAARAKREPGQALVGMGHLYMTGTRISELSERRILGGNQHALPHDLFPDDMAYAALGHLHLAQEVGRRGVRYSGSPIPLSMSEIHYPHQVCLVDLDGEELAEVTPLRVPRAVELLRIPERDSLDKAALLDRLAALPPMPEGADPALRPFLEVRVRLDRPEPSLRNAVEAALEGKHARLVRIGLELGGDGRSLADRVVDEMLEELLPEKVFTNRWVEAYGGEPPADMMSAFLDLVEQVHQEKRS